VKKSFLIFIVVILVLVFFSTSAKTDVQHSDSFLISGNIEATEVSLSFRIPGVIDQRLLNEGDIVKAGQLVAKLNQDEQIIALDKAKAKLEVEQAKLAELIKGSRKEEIDKALANFEKAKIHLKQLQNGPRKQEIKSARAQVLNAKAAIKKAQASFEMAKADEKRFAKLYKARAIGRKEYEQYLTGFKTAKEILNSANANLESARQKLSLLKDGTRPEVLGKAEQDLTSTKAHFALVKKGPRSEKIAMAKANVKLASASVDAASLQLKFTSLLSPIEGVVLAKGLEAGEFASPGISVVSITDLNKVWLRGYINETMLGKIKLGQDVEVSIDSFSTKKFKGKIAFISQEAEFTPKTVQTHEERVKLVYRIKINLDNPDWELKPGMPADAKIKLN
jgi:HlyD family secretion protein